MINKMRCFTVDVFITNVVVYNSFLPLGVGEGGGGGGDRVGGASFPL